MKKILFFLLVLIVNSLFAETTVNVIIPNDFSDGRNILSVTAFYCVKYHNKLSPKQSITFEPNKNFNGTWIWTAIVPNIQNGDSSELFVDVRFTMNSGDLSIDPIDVRKCEQGSNNSFYRWIRGELESSTTNFDVNPKTTDVTNTQIIQDVTVLQNIISRNFGLMLGEHFVDYRKLKQVDDMDITNCKDKSYLCYMNDFENLTEYEILQKLRTRLNLLIEQICFNENMSRYTFQCEFGIDEGEYFKIHIYLQ